MQMKQIYKLLDVAVIAFVSLSRALPLTFDNQQRFAQPSEEQDSYQLPSELELPKEDTNAVPFFAPEPVNFLKPPQESQEPNYYQVPIPNQDLVPPTDTEWNPSNDPIYYYEIPAIITKQELPTKEFPKKYNEDVHDKKKPYSFKPKQEIVFEPISLQQFEDKQNSIVKTFDKQSKNENQKNIKVLSSRKIPISKTKLQNESKPTDLISTPTHIQPKPTDIVKAPSRKILIPRKKSQNIPTRTNTEPKPTDSVANPADSIPNPTLSVPYPTYYEDLLSTISVAKPTDNLIKPTDSFTISSDETKSDTEPFDHGLSSQLTASLGIPSSAPVHGGASKGERLEFHIAGHDGPHSYKWGYDTGKGHNRLFRFEERDNEGIVKGHYGFYDKEGKLQVTHYDAHPHTGFHVHENS